VCAHTERELAGIVWHLSLRDDATTTPFTQKMVDKSKYSLFN